MNQQQYRSGGTTSGSNVVIAVPHMDLLRDWRSAVSSDFVRKVMETYATRVLLIGVGLVTSVAIARMLGPTGRGLYAVAAATGTLGVQFGNMGLHAANVYFVARDPDSLSELVANSLAVSLGFGGLVSVALAIVFHLFPNLIALHGMTLFLTLIWIPLGLAYLLMQNLMLGVHDVRGYNLLETVNRILPLAFIAGLAFLRQRSVATFFGAGVVALAIGSTWTWTRLRLQCARGPVISLALFRASIRYALKAYLAALFAFLVLRADLFMVQHMLGVEQAGYYSVASSMADYISVIAVVIGTILFPRLSAMTDMNEKLNLTQKTAWATAGVLLPLLLLASLLARPAVHLLFGAAFLPAALAFILLMPGMLFLGINSVAVQFLNSIGYPKSVVVVWGLCCVFNICVDVWAIPHFGIAGASVVSSVSYFLAFFFIFRIIRSFGLRGRIEGLE
jgi:O-antigen/teichoic acid export membrane protein